MQSSDTVELLPDWPQLGTGNRGPLVRYGHGAALIAYDTPDERVAVATFPICLQMSCGFPNDEVRTAHPLYAKGLTHYAVHRIVNSSRLAAIARANSAHPRHDSASYLKDKQHWVFTFQDCTVECLALAGAGREPSFRVFSSWGDANAFIATNREG
jgi:hypothetical protein